MRVAICDDNSANLETYGKEIEQLALKHGIGVTVEKYQSGDELLFKIGGNLGCPDVLYLDIRMPGTPGNTVAQQLREMDITTEIIFLTGYKDYMQDAFDVDAFHYIVKGETSPEKFERIFLKVADRVGKKKKEVIAFSCAGETRIVPIRDIHYFEVKNYIVAVHYGRESFEFCSTLGKIENSLLGRDFLRIHRSYLVSMNSVKEISRQELTLNDGRKLPVGRNYWNEIKRQAAEKELALV